MTSAPPPGLLRPVVIIAFLYCIATTAIADTRITVKFSESFAVRLRSGQLLADVAIGAPPPPPSPGQLALAQTQLNSIYALLMTPPAPATSIVASMRDLEAQTDALTLRLRQAGKTVPDLNNYIEVSLRITLTPAEIDAIIAALRAFSIVVNAQILPAEPPPPPQAVDIPPTTPDFTAQQLHLLVPGQGANPTQFVGIAAANAWALLGGKGRGVRLIDIEYRWREHEDMLPLDPMLSLAAAADVDGTGLDDRHATAVHGLVAAQHNGYGTHGIAPDVRFGMVSTVSAGFFVWDVPHAIIVASNRLRPGDLILVEQQLAVLKETVPAAICRSVGTTYILVPVESIAAVADAVRVATAAGISVIMTASNGGCNLDDPVFASFASPSTDTGSVYVSIGRPDLTTIGERAGPTGARVDVQAWGQVTAGYSAGLIPILGAESDPRQWYTSLFGGTSAAGAVIAGVASSVQGIKRNYIRGRPYTPLELRALLRANVVPQPSADATTVGRLGGLPVFTQLIPAMTTNPICSPDYFPTANCNLDVDGDGTLSEWDALFILRYLLGFRGDALVAGQPLPPTSCATRLTGLAVQVQIEALLTSSADPLDLDGDGQVRATTDGLLLLRAIINPGVTVPAGALGITATRKDWNAIRGRLNTACNAQLVP